MFEAVSEAIWGLVGVVVGGSMTIAKDSVSAWRQSRKVGSFSAVRLASILREYADHCIDVVGDDGTSHGMPAGRTESGEEYYAAQVRLPDPPNYLDEIGWRSLPNDLMFRALSLPNKARLTDRHIEGVSEFVAFPPGYEEYFDARQEGYARLGLEALTLAEDLAKEFRFSFSEPEMFEVKWDSKAFLAQKVAEFDARREKENTRLKDVTSHDI